MKYLLAPLEEHSDVAFRMLCHSYGCSFSYVEMVSLVALPQSTFPWYLFDSLSVVPSGVQVMATRVSQITAFLAALRERSISVPEFNLNLGCPDPGVIQMGGGAALLKRVTRVQALVNALHSFGAPVTIKLRLGLNQFEKDKKVYLSLLHHVDADAFIIHAKHAREESFTKADLTVFEECLETGKTIVANGSIVTREDIIYLSSLGIHSVMLGRAALANPSVFQWLQGGKLEDISSVRERYDTIQTTYPSRELYKTHFVKWLGRKF